MAERPVDWSRRPTNERLGAAVFQIFRNLRDIRKKVGVAPEGVAIADHQRRLSERLLPLICDVVAAAIAESKDWLILRNDLDVAIIDQLLRILSASEKSLFRVKLISKDQDFGAIQASEALLRWISDHGFTADDLTTGGGEPHATAPDLRKSIPIDLHMKLDGGWLGLVTDLVDETATHFSIEDERPSSRRQRIDAMNVIIANLANCWRQGPDQFVAISRTEGTYTKGRYANNSLGYDNFVRCIDYLKDRNQGAYVDHHIGFNDRIRGKSYNTRIRMTQLLNDRIVNNINKIDENRGKDSEVISSRISTYTSALPITRRLSLSLLTSPNKHGGESLVMKDEDKNLIEYVDTDESSGLRERLASWNSFANENWVDLFLPDREVDSLYQDDPADEAHPWDREDAYDPHYVDLNRTHLYRVFNNRSWDQGGRFYGGWWQSIPRTKRPYITINWHPAREVDYSGLHINMLYHLREKNPPDEPYEIAGIPAEYRDLIKETLLTIINAGKDQKVERPEPNELPPNMDWPTFVDAIKAAHQPIADDFNSGSGIRLQRVDSDIAESVMLTMMKKDILVLPIHDSFMVRRGYDGALREAMEKAYREKMKAEIGFKAKLSFRDLEPPDEITSSFKEIGRLIDEDGPIKGYESYFDRKTYFQTLFGAEKSHRFEY